MRLLLWVLLVTLVTFISSASATATVTDSKDITVSQLTDSEIDELSRLLTAETDDDNTKPFLRGDAKKDLTTAGDKTEDEERGLFSLISSIKNGWAKWKSNALEKAFQHMMKHGETPTTLAKRLEIGGATEPRYERLYEKLVDQLPHDHRYLSSGCDY
ncbi:hypothetical protein PHYSODRAFT_284377 [Phytophthora sojae]|uniref:RxLR effector protein n=2 Tax=Phytophthora sojae TaxID=67593 RepID=G4YE04_PHYSP|nr:hypothetical protein PHYSODRAFT_284377 [Phytophthora sojae]AEK80872.1 Avh189 [Phytophthora sojae]AEK80873.1 Avh189 [Phytophthora sojae]EGZ29022.1 hypothetical protein PHYSODRAFT_284377 [Phytophthora sojae]|eukprot:XP_009516297.1 hypothetical protein PHYSODRAFT_284377 [Phytophthora sojae]